MTVQGPAPHEELAWPMTAPREPLTKVTEVGRKPGGTCGPLPAVDSAGPFDRGAPVDGRGLGVPAGLGGGELGTALLDATRAGFTPGNRFPASWGSPPAAAMITATPAAAPIVRTALRLRARRRTRW